MAFSLFFTLWTLRSEISTAVFSGRNHPPHLFAGLVIDLRRVGGGRRLANTPRHGYSLGTRFRSDSGFFGNLELVGRSRQFDSNNQDEARGAFNVVNTSIGYAYGAWTVTVWGRNIFDQRYQKRVFFFGNEDPGYVPARYETQADPRQFGLTANYRF
ncbi:MAG: TonB-dependent receptor domain-containing protein [Opitutaceae bacterium]